MGKDHMNRLIEVVGVIFLLSCGSFLCTMTAVLIHDNFINPPHLVCVVNDEPSLSL